MSIEPSDVGTPNELASKWYRCMRRVNKIDALLVKWFVDCNVLEGSLITLASALPEFRVVVKLAILVPNCAELSF
jgi:hypothetical protein